MLLMVNINYFLVFFFSSRRRHTRCLSDWSSDVCSSDLVPAQALLAHQVLRAPLGRVEVTLTRQRLRATRSQQSADLLTSPLPSMDGWRSVRRFMSGGRQQAGQPVATIT